MFSVSLFVTFFRIGFSCCRFILICLAMSCVHVCAALRVCWRRSQLTLGSAWYEWQVTFAPPSVSPVMAEAWQFLHDVYCRFFKFRCVCVLLRFWFISTFYCTGIRCYLISLLLYLRLNKLCYVDPDRFWRNLVWTLCHLRKPQNHISQFCAICKNKMLNPQTSAVGTTLTALSLEPWNDSWW